MDRRITKSGEPFKKVGPKFSKTPRTPKSLWVDNGKVDSMQKLLVLRKQTSPEVSMQDLYNEAFGLLLDANKIPYNRFYGHSDSGVEL